MPISSGTEACEKIIKFYQEARPLQKSNLVSLNEENLRSMACNPENSSLSNLEIDVSQ
jgi:hypothetical protein